jgi:hypothetical protein
MIFQTVDKIWLKKLNRSLVLSSSPSTILGPASSAAAVASLALKALGCSSVELLVSSVHSSSPPKVSSPVAVAEKFSTAVLQQVAVVAFQLLLEKKRDQCQNVKKNVNLAFINETGTDLISNQNVKEAEFRQS